MAICWTRRRKVRSKERRNHTPKRNQEIERKEKTLVDGYKRYSRGGDLREIQERKREREVVLRKVKRK